MKLSEEARLFLYQLHQGDASASALAIAAV